MKFRFSALLLVFSSLLILSCGGDYRKAAVGEFGHATVVMDSTEWDSETANAIRSAYGSWIETLPRPEPKFSLTFKDINNNEDLESIKKRKNIIIAAPIDEQSNVGDFVRALLDDQVEDRVRQGEAFAFSFEDRWYQDQWSMVLTSTSDSALAEKINRGEEGIVRSLLDKELKRWTYELYDKGEQKQVAQDSLWNKHGWKVRVQHDYVVNIDTSYAVQGDSVHFLTMRRVLPSNDRWFWAWWKEGVSDIDFLDGSWINQKRDSLMKDFILGTQEGSYVTTEYRRPVNTRSFQFNGNLTYETLGTWKMVGDAMGGPFANLTVYDDTTQRLFMIEFGQFAPKYNKRRFRRQFRAMLRTFRSDSTWNTSKSLAAE